MSALEVVDNLDVEQSNISDIISVNFSDPAINDIISRILTTGEAVPITASVSTAANVFVDEVNTFVENNNLLQNSSYFEELVHAVEEIKEKKSKDSIIKKAETEKVHQINLNDIVSDLFLNNKNKEYIDYKQFYDKKLVIKKNEDNRSGKTVIIVVGCGGTGSRLINLLAQYHFNHLENTELYLIDNDVV